MSLMEHSAPVCRPMYRH